MQLMRDVDPDGVKSRAKRKLNEGLTEARY